MDFFDSGWLKYYKKLETINLNNFQEEIENMTGQGVNCSYHLQEEIISEKIDTSIDNFSVIEIGGGFGELSNRLINKCKNITTYTLVDHPAMLNVAKYYLDTKHPNKIVYIETTNIENLFKNKYNLFISCNCLTETPNSYQEYIYKNIFPICDMVCILDGEQGPNSVGTNFNNRLIEALNKTHSIVTVTNPIIRGLFYGKGLKK